MVILQSPSKIPRVLLSFYGLPTGTVKDADGLLGSQNCTLSIFWGTLRVRNFSFFFLKGECTFMVILQSPSKIPRVLLSF